MKKSQGQKEVLDQLGGIMRDVHENEESINVAIV
jgi:hypothetical protein